MRAANDRSGVPSSVHRGLSWIVPWRKSRPRWCASRYGPVPLAPIYSRRGDLPRCTAADPLLVVCPATQDDMRREKGASRFAGFAAILAITTAFPTTGSAHEGWGIVVDASGRIYVGDIPANTIWRISRDGIVERIARKHSHALH